MQPIRNKWPSRMPCCLSCRENVKIRAIIAALTVAEGSCETGENILSYEQSEV